ncbi:PREDICTED: uncharacterized protein LOC104605878 [Nelumbo nucifera]|uniref:Uncharacterized protein LOC104605878 n=2 Tax=Nelumbo nucifera TaxID=4432 RepID=A0A1U8AZY5_NELNU|nr:PREDICTED: uncharacterized protein LOC104605878 [Nelumbo nucifera]DAD24726.1 TPA_asm: hypothetical protein HUJ06_026190 [Nelumbo nucifera]
MSVPDPRIGNICIWLISCFFLATITAGGVFLLLYIFFPETESTAWFPVAGMVLVSVPWLFWFLTLVYRCISRDSIRGVAAVGPAAARCSTGGGGGGWRGGGANVAGVQTIDMGGVASSAGPESPTHAAESPDNRVRRVRFGAAVVVGELDDNMSQEKDDDDDDEENHQASVSIGSSVEYDNLSSSDSRECELPLTLSMHC